MIIVYKEIVVEISAHFLGGDHRGIDVEVLSVGERREDVRKHILLDTGSEVKLCTYPFLFLDGIRKVFLIFRKVPFHIGQGKIQVFYLVSGINPQIFEMPGLPGSSASFILCVLHGSPCYAVYGLHHFLPDVVRKEKAQKENGYSRSYDILQNEIPHAVQELRHGNICQNEARYGTVLGIYRRSRSAKPPVLLGICDLVRNALAVPSQKLVHFFSPDLLPGARRAGPVGVRIRHVDKMIIFPVVYAYEDIVDSAVSLEVPEDFHYGPIVRTFRHLSEFLKILLILYFAVFLRNALINVYGLPAAAAHVYHVTHHVRCVLSKLKGRLYVLVTEGIDVESKPRYQCHYTKDQCSHQDRMKSFSLQGKVPSFPGRHLFYGLFRHGALLLFYGEDIAESGDLEDLADNVVDVCDLHAAFS